MTNPIIINNNFYEIESTNTTTDYHNLPQEEIESSTKQDARNFSPFKLLPTETLWKSSQPFIDSLPKVNLSFSLEELIDCNPLLEPQTFSLPTKGEEYSTTFTAQELFSYIISKTEEQNPTIEIVGGFNREALKRLPSGWIQSLFARHGCHLSEEGIQEALSSFLKRELPDTDFRYYGKKSDSDGRFPYPNLIIDFLYEKFEGKVPIETLSENLSFTPVGIEGGLHKKNESSSFYICPVGKLDITFVLDGRGLQVERLFSHDRIYTPVLSLEAIPDLHSSHFLESLLFYLTKRLVLNSGNQGKLHRTALYAYLFYISRGWIPQNEILTEEISRLLSGLEYYEIALGIKNSVKKHYCHASVMNYVYAFNTLLENGSNVDNWEFFKVDLLFNNLEKIELNQTAPFIKLIENFKGLFEGRTRLTPRDIKALFHLAACMLACASTACSQPCQISLPHHDGQRFIQLIWEQGEGSEPLFLLLSWEPERACETLAALCSREYDKKAATAIREFLQQFSPSISYSEHDYALFSEEEAAFLMECRETLQQFTQMLIGNLDNMICQALFLELANQFPRIALDDLSIVSKFPELFQRFPKEGYLALIETINQYCLANEIDLSIPLKPFQSKRASFERLTGMWILSLLQSNSPKMREHAFEIFSNYENAFNGKDKEEITVGIIKSAAKFDLGKAYGLYQEYLNLSWLSLESRARLFNTFCNCLKSSRHNQYDHFLTEELRVLSENFNSIENPKTLLDNCFWFYKTRNLQTDPEIQKCLQAALLACPSSINSDISDFISEMVEICGSEEGFYERIEFLNEPLLNLLSQKQKAVLILSLLNFASSNESASSIILLTRHFLPLKNQIEPSDNALIIDRLLNSTIGEPKHAETLNLLLETFHYAKGEIDELLSLAIDHLKRPGKQHTFPLLEDKLAALWKKSNHPFLFLDDLCFLASKGSKKFLKTLHNALKSDLKASTEKKNYAESLKRINQLNETGRGTKLSEKMCQVCITLIKELDSDSLQPFYNICGTYAGDRVKELAISLFDRAKEIPETTLTFLLYDQHDMKQYLSSEELSQSIDRLIANEKVPIQEKLTLLEQFPTLKRLLSILQSPLGIPDHDFSSMIHQILESPRIWEEDPSDLFSLFDIWDQYSKEAIYNNLLKINSSNWKKFGPCCESILHMLNHADAAMGIPLWLTNVIEFFMLELSPLTGHKKKKYSLQENFNKIHSSLMDHFRINGRHPLFRVKTAVFLQSIGLTNEMAEILYSIDTQHQSPEGASKVILNILNISIENEAYDSLLIKHLEPWLLPEDLRKIKASLSLLTSDLADIDDLLDTCTFNWRAFEDEPKKQLDKFRSLFKLFLQHHYKNDPGLIDHVIPSLFMGCLNTPSAIVATFEPHKTADDPNSDTFNLVPERFSEGQKDQLVKLISALFEESYQYIKEEINTPDAVHLHNSIYPLLEKAMEAAPSSPILKELVASHIKTFIKKLIPEPTTNNCNYLQLLSSYFDDQHLHKINYHQNDIETVFKTGCLYLSEPISEKNNKISMLILGVLISMTKITKKKSSLRKLNGLIYYLMVSLDEIPPERSLKITKAINLKSALQAIDTIKGEADCNTHKNIFLERIFTLLLQQDQLSHSDMETIGEIGNQFFSINKIKRSIKNTKLQLMGKALYAASQLVLQIPNVEIYLAHKFCLYYFENSFDEKLQLSLTGFSDFIISKCKSGEHVDPYDIFSVFYLEDDSLFKLIQKKSHTNFNKKHLINFFTSFLTSIYFNNSKFQLTLEDISNYLKITKEVYFENKTDSFIDINYSTIELTDFSINFYDLIDKKTNTEQKISCFSDCLETTEMIIEIQQELIELFNKNENIKNKKELKKNLLYQTITIRKSVNILMKLIQQSEVNSHLDWCENIHFTYKTLEEEFFANLDNILSLDDLLSLNNTDKLNYLKGYTTILRGFYEDLSEKNYFGESVIDVLGPVTEQISGLSMFVTCLIFGKIIAQSDEIEKEENFSNKAVNPNSFIPDSSREIAKRILIDCEKIEEIFETLSKNKYYF